MLKVLDEILLSDNAVERFYKEYENKGFKNWLLSVLPEVEDCKLTEQDNPWHVHNCLNHILFSVQEINKQTSDLNSQTRRMLAYVMFFHDIGKPQCKIRRFSKLYNRYVDSFFNHNKASAQIASRVLKDFKFNEKESEIILTLIDKHDIFMNLTLTDDGNSYHKVLTKNLLKQEVEKLDKIDNGESLMRYLIMVGRADNKAQNPEMTSKSLKLLDVMEDMLENLDKEKESY